MDLCACTWDKGNRDGGGGKACLHMLEEKLEREF